jgi:hypothetical protein
MLSIIMILFWAANVSFSTSAEIMLLFPLSGVQLSHFLSLKMGCAQNNLNLLFAFAFCPLHVSI